MTSEELAQEIMNAVVAVQARILGVGKEQYDQGGEQQFERMSIRELIQYAREEVEDGIAYNVMLRWRLNQLEKALNSAFKGYQEPAGRHAKTDSVEQFDAFQPTDWADLRDAARGIR